MGLFSWLRGKPAGKPGNKPAARKPAGPSREELIANALNIRAEKKKEFDKLDPEVRVRLLRQAMGKTEPDDEA
jgi:hypothetical protein